MPAKPTIAFTLPQPCPKCGAEPGADHTITTAMPLARIIRTVWRRNKFSRATDGCRIGWNDHYCKHGHQSWRDVLKTLKIKGRPPSPEEIFDDEEEIIVEEEEIEEEEESEEENEEDAETD